MEIEEQRRAFLNILQARCVISEGEEISLSEQELIDNELGNRTFWDTLCPLLVKLGILKEFTEDRSSVGSGEFQALIRDLIRHTFVVDRRKLFESTKPVSNIKPKHIVVLDTPPETTWEKMRFQFTGRLSLHVSVPVAQWVRERMTPKDFGLEKKSGKPKTQWIILKTMSMNDARFPLQNVSVGKARDSKKRQLTELARTLEEIFPKVGGGRPIRPTFDGKGYECSFKLIPDQSDKDEHSFSDIQEQGVEDGSERADESE